MSTLHAFDFLDKNDGTPWAVCALFGDEPFLKQLAVKKLQQRILGDAPDAPVASFDGRNTEWRDVIDELSTASLFGGETRIAIVDPADDFVSKNRSQLEDYVARPKATGTLILVVDSWPANTRLYKAIDKTGLQVECRAPERGRGRNKQPDEKRLGKWLSSWAKSWHNITLPAASAEALLELVGPHLGLLDQELAKLVLFTEVNGKVTPQLVHDVAGGWRTKTIWELIDAAANGDAATALAELNRLLQAGDHPLALFGALSWSMRRFATATRIFQQAERDGQRMKLADAMEMAGFFPRQREDFARAQKQLLQLGRERAGQLYRWLLDADLAMKGSHSADHRARLVLERLILKMSKGLAPKRRQRTT